MTLIAPPQQLYETLISILIGRGWRYLRYRHFRAALQMAKETRTVLSVGAGKGLAEVALALEFPDIVFTIAELPKAMKGLKRARNLVRRLKLRNVRFKSVDLLGWLPSESYDLVAAVDTLQYLKDAGPAAARMATLSRRWVYCQVPFADEARRKDPIANQNAFREFQHYVVGFDAKTLLRLFPEPEAIRGCFWNDAGVRLRDRLQSLSDDSIRDSADDLLANAERDLRPGWAADRSEAQGVWILSRVPAPKERGVFQRLLGLGRANPHTRAWEQLDDRRVVEISGMFDAEFYTRTQPDVAGQDALAHYFAIGAERGAWANPTFDSAFYVRQSRIEPARQNPLAHYILEGRARRLPTFDRHSQPPMAMTRSESPRSDVRSPVPPPPRPSSPPPAPTADAGKGKAPSKLRTLLEGSGLFDEAYYLKHNSDIAQKQVEPLGHYIKNGAREGRNPNALFDTHDYAKRANIDPAQVNPLFHYITEGEALGLVPSVRFDLDAYRLANPESVGTGLTVLAHAIAQAKKQREATNAARQARPLQPVSPVDLLRLKLTIVIPVYNGGDHVRRCLDSVLTETLLPFVQLLVLDDASPDPHTQRVLADYAQLPNVELRRNDENLGFTRNVNLALSIVEADRDVVLLNADTIVGPRWLEHLALAAHSDPRNATATALSDNAGAFSTPEVEYNPTLQHLDVASAARLSRRAAVDEVQSFPTGSGFCMYMRREAINAVGGFDAVLFPRGYGEENDWCLRAAEHGFRHVIALRSYVAHVNAVSFGASQKTQLRQAARKVLDERHPDYSAQLREGVANAQALSSQRAAFAVALQQKPAALPKILYVTSTKTGGVPQTNQDLMSGVGLFFSPMMLECNSRELTLWDTSQATAVELETHVLRERVGIMTHLSTEYDDVVRSWLVKHDVELLHIRHIAWHSLGLARVARSLGIPVVFSFHDFYTLCPSINLIGGHERWQETGVTEPHIVAPLWQGVDEVGFQQARLMNGRAFIDMWRRRMGLMIEQCNLLVTTSQSAKALIEAQLPAARRSDGSFVVIPHGRDFEHYLEPPEPPRAGEPLRVLAAGNIAEAKGMVTFLNLLELDTQRRIELHVVGGTKVQLGQHPRVKAYGRYPRAGLTELIQKIRPHVSAILSICPETFCHTLTESWAAGLPVVGSEVGAVGERMSATGAGWIVDPLDAPAVLARLYSICDGTADWAQKLEAVQKWQREVAPARTVAAMARDYMDLYRRAMTGQRPLLPRAGRKGVAGTRVALVGKGHYPDAPPTVHIRLATPVRVSSGKVAYEWVEAAELVRKGASDFDGVVVCRNACDGRVLTELSRVCEQTQLPLVLDLDDDLLDVPADKDMNGHYVADLAGVEAMLRCASLTTVTTDELSRAYSPRSRAVKVAPNALDRALWFDPVERAAEAPDGWVKDARFRIVYVGSNTHAEDLDLVMPVIARLAKSHGMALHLVGIEKKVRPGCHRIWQEEHRYDRFVPWFRSIAGYFDVAIAPLADTPFNRRKSAIKFMDYAACGLPVVASRVPPYSTVIREGVDGLLADDEESWAAALIRLATEPDLRQRLAVSASNRATTEFVSTSCIFDSVDWRSQAVAAAVVSE